MFVTNHILPCDFFMLVLSVLLQFELLIPPIVVLVTNTFLEDRNTLLHLGVPGHVCYQTEQIVNVQEISVYEFGLL